MLVRTATVLAQQVFKHLRRMVAASVVIRLKSRHGVAMEALWKVRRDGTLTTILRELLTQ